MKRLLTILCIVWGVAAWAQPTTSDIWINEFHYDGVTIYGQSDQNEFIEIVVKSSLYNNAAEMAKLKLVLYTSGALDSIGWATGRGVPYNVSSPLYSLAETEYPLSSFQSCASTSIEFTILNKPMNILQDVPAAMAIVYNNTTVVQLLSYEKQFKMAPTGRGGGPAAGMTTSLIKVGNRPAMETATTPNTHSIALEGSGFTYNTFQWNDAVTVTATPCATNNNQTFAAGSPLPVRWLDFRASGEANKIYLQWRLADEANAIKYEIELSSDGSRFTKAGEVMKNATLAGKYNHTLTNLSKGLYYVRIKEIENGGRSYYSTTKQVRLTGTGKGLLVYPNPVKDKNVLLQFRPAEKGIYTATLTDATGRIVKQQTIQGLETDQQNTIPLDVSNVPAGTYRLKVRGKVEELTTSIVIAN